MRVDLLVMDQLTRDVILALKHLRESVRDRKQLTVRTELNNLSTCVLLFFPDPQRSLRSQNWTHAASCDSNLQAGSAFCYACFKVIRRPSEYD